jgi:hypothetical protein
MKIMISNDTGLAHYYIRIGLMRAFTALGHDAVMWDITKKSVHDAFSEFEPDLFIGQTYNINRALIKCLGQRPNCKSIMKGSDWGEISDTIDRQKYPVLIANEEEIDNVKALREANGLDYIFVHYLQRHVDKTHSHWKDIVSAKSLLSAADVFEFTGGVSKPEYECDLGFLGGRWGYKAQTLDKYFVPLLGEELNVKIFGNQSWGIPEYCGFLPDGEVRHFLASAKICPNISEPHSQDFGYDIIERPFKLAANKCFVISDYVEGLQEVYPEMCYAETPELFKKAVYSFLEKPDERQEIVEVNYQHTIKNHTYFERVAEIFKNLDMPYYETEAIALAQQIKGKMNL